MSVLEDRADRLDLDPPVGTTTRSWTRMVVALAVVGSVGWRRGEYFSGSLDPVVVAKAVVGLLALLLSLHLALRWPRRSVGTGTLWWLGVLLAGAVLGALIAGHPAGVVIAVRVAVLAATMISLLRAVTGFQLLTELGWACGAIAAVAAVTGFSGLTEMGRLAGGVPEMAPNELALVAGLAVLVLVWRMVLDGVRPISFLTTVALLGVVWATGSRTGLLMLVLAVLVVGAHIRRPQVGLVVSALVFGAVAVVAVAASDTVSSFAERDGDGASTLDSRFIAWRASLTWAANNWELVFGGGLSVKIIRVPGQFWATQPLDSSWVSLLVQTGVLGVAAAAGWVLWVVRGTLRAPRPYRILFLGLLIFLVGRSILESGLFDATPALVVFLAVSLLAEGGSRVRLRAETAALPHRPATTPS